MVSLFGRGRNANDAVDPNPLFQMLLRRLDFVEYDRLVTMESMLTAHDRQFANVEQQLRMLNAYVSRDVQRRRLAEPEEASPASALQESQGSPGDLAIREPQQTPAADGQLAQARISDNINSAAVVSLPRD